MLLQFSGMGLASRLCRNFVSYVRHIIISTPYSFLEPIFPPVDKLQIVNIFLQYYPQNWVLFLLRFIVLFAIVNAEFDVLFVNFVYNGGNSDDRVIKNTTFTIK
jgi:hypothetical protein